MLGGDGIVRKQLVPSRVLFDKPVGRLTADGALPVGFVYMRDVGPPSKVIDVAEQQVLIAGARANAITGTINGIETATLQFFDIRDVTLTTGAAADRITLPHGNGGLAAQGLVNFTLNTGGGSDIIAAGRIETALPEQPRGMARHVEPCHLEPHTLGLFRHDPAVSPLPC